MGTGGQGKVYHAIDKEKGKEYAVKITDLSKYGQNERLARLEKYQQELDLLQKIDSIYITKYYGQAAEPDRHQYYLLLEFCNSDLLKLMRKRKVLSEKEAQKINWQIFNAQHDLNGHKIIHRDLKPGNIGLLFDGYDSQ